VRISGYGISIVPPSGWDAHLYSRPLVEPSALPAGVGAPFVRRPSAEGGAATLHAGNFALPADNGEFGTEATSSMPPDGVFLALVEYQTGQGLEPGRGLFAPRRVPVPLGLSDFHPATLLRALHGQVGAQHFFTVADRPLCLYAVLGPRAQTRPSVAELNQALLSLEILRR
jgi:hypothetical protein